MLGVQHGGMLLLLSLHSLLMSHAGLMIAHYTAAALGEFPLNYGQCLALYLHKGISEVAMEESAEQGFNVV